MHSHRFYFVLPFAALLLLPLDASAATLVVDGASYRTITAALADAADGDTIEVAAGTWYECLVVTRSVEIVGVSGSASTALDGAGVCDIAMAVEAPGGTVGLTGFSVTAPYGQALVAAATELVLDDVVVTASGDADVASGAGITFSGDTLSLTDTTVQDNVAAECAGLDVGAGTKVTITGGGFEGNEAASGSGGAICLGSSSASPSSLMAEDVTFSANLATGSGIALDIGEAASARTTDCAFADNTGVGSGGAIELAADTDYTSTGDLFTDNGGSDSDGGSMEGAALNAQAGGTTILVTDGGFRRNFVALGGAAIVLDGGGTTLSVFSSSFSANARSINSYEPSVRLSDCTFSRDTGVAVSGPDVIDSGSAFSDSGDYSFGGGGTLDGTQFSDHSGLGVIYASGALTLTNCVVEDNDTTSHSSVYVANDATISGCAFSRNTSTYGGVIEHASETALVVSDSTFDDNAASYGGAIASYGGGLQVQGSTFTGNSAAGGGAIWIGVSREDGWMGSAAVTIEDAFFENNTATHTDGGAVSQDGVGTLEVSDSFFLGNVADETGGAIYADQLDATEITNVFACANEAGGGGAFSISNTSSVQLLHVILQENVGIGGGGALYLRTVPVFTLSHATVVGNSGYAASGGGAYFNEVAGTVTDSIFAYTAAGDAVYAHDEATGGDLDLTYNDWYANTTDDRSGTFVFATTGFGNTTADPGFADYSLDGDCWNDALALTTGSLLIDAGSPESGDADGTAADMGATGGPESRWVDGDGDGWLSDWDCDDAAAAVSPDVVEICDGSDNNCDGEIDESSAADATNWYADTDADGFGDAAAPVVSCAAPEGYVANAVDCDDDDPARGGPVDEVPYDGVDQDCDGGDLRDVDGDGHDATGVGGDDCDDARADVNPTAADSSADGVDQDCDGHDGPSDTGIADTDSDTGAPPAVEPDSSDPGDEPSDCACANSGRKGAAWALGYVAIVIVSRRRMS